MSFDINSFTWQEEVDSGRNTGMADRFEFNGNSGPLIRSNRIWTSQFNDSDVSTLNGLEVRGGQVATEVVLDDVDIVHIVRDMIEIPNQHIYGGLRLQSDARGSLVLKFQNQDVENADAFLRQQAGIVAGGTLITAEDEFLDIDDRIGGSLQIVGHPDFPVVLTALSDDTVGAGFTHLGGANFDTDNNGRREDANGDPIFVLTSTSGRAASRTSTTAAAGRTI